VFKDATQGIQNCCISELYITLVHSNDLKLDDTLSVREDGRGMKTLLWNIFRTFKEGNFKNGIRVLVSIFYMYIQKKGPFDEPRAIMKKVPQDFSR
jgi:hypothetical protein